MMNLNVKVLKKVIFAHFWTSNVGFNMICNIDENQLIFIII